MSINYDNEGEDDEGFLCVCVLQTLVCSWSESLETLEETILCPCPGENIIDSFYKVTKCQ